MKKPNSSTISAKDSLKAVATPSSATSFPGSNPMPRTGSLYLVAAAATPASGDCLPAAVPDLHGTLHRWGATEDGVFIEFTLGGTLGRGQVAVDVVDRIMLHNGFIASNDTYFDSVPLLPRMLTHPILALRLLPRFFVSQIERDH
jgi:hypothetical protein